MRSKTTVIDSKDQHRPGDEREAVIGIFAHTGEYWTIGFAGARFNLKDSKGLHYIERLLRHPGEEFHVLDLASESGPNTTSDNDASSVAYDSTLNLSRLGDSGEVLDARAKQEYKRRLGELREEFEELRNCGAHERAAKVESEIECLEREIARAVGLGGRSRRAGSAAERARLNVTRLIRMALDKISEHDGALGTLLDRSIRTGSFCSYFPDPRTPISWQFSSEYTTPADQISRPGRGTVFVPASSFSRGVTPIMVGREAELNRMRAWYEQALAGQRRIVFVAGEAGIGKTTFVRAFLDSVNADGTRIELGQCIERYGAGEPYMPVLEALTRLCNGTERERVIEVLKEFASSWLIQIPSLLSVDEQRLQATMGGVTQQRMLREMTQALEALTAEKPLVLTLEDLHWSDYSTLELISAIARRAELARLLIIGTYRPVEMLQGDHPLHAIKAELELHHYCNELRLKPLNERDVAAYLKRRLGDGEAYESLARKAPAIYRRTEGNPLFMVNVVDYLLEQGPHIDLAALEAPHNIFQMIERNVERLDGDQQRILEAASVAGAEFSASAVAAALGSSVTEVEACCMRLARREQFVAADGTIQWPDGTVASMFRFHHTFYGEVLYGRLAAGQRIELHRRIAEREEAAWGERANEIAIELAHHYGKAGQIERSIGYLERAGQQATQLGAFKEAQESYQQALGLLKLLPESPERDARELKLRQSLVTMLHITRGWAAPETVEAAERIGVLVENCGNLGLLVRSMNERCFQAYLAGDLSAAAALADEGLELALRQGNPTELAYLYMSQLLVRYYRSDFAGAENHFAAGLKCFDDPAFRRNPSGGAIMVFGTASRNAWILGRADVARERLAKMRAVVNPANPHALAWSDCLAAALHAGMREYEAAQALAVHALDLCEKHGFPNVAAFSRCLLGHARAQLGGAADGIALIRGGMDALLQIGSRISVPSFLTYLAAAQLRAGASGDALETVEQALNFNPEEAAGRPETLRIRGELRLKQGDRQLAEADFRDSIAMARSMGAKAWELRTTMSLARLLASKGRRNAAHSMLAAIYNWFTEGFDTADLKDAKALLEELAK